MGKFKYEIYENEDWYNKIDVWLVAVVHFILHILAGKIKNDEDL